MNKKLLMKTALVASFLIALSACGDDTAEETGEQIDEVITDTGNAIEDACEDVKEGVDAKDKDC